MDLDLFFSGILNEIENSRNCAITYDIFFLKKAKMTIILQIFSRYYKIQYCCTVLGITSNTKVLVKYSFKCCYSESDNEMPEEFLHGANVFIELIIVSNYLYVLFDELRTPINKIMNKK